MKKQLFIGLCLMLMCSGISAQEVVVFSSGTIDDMPLGNGFPKQPINPPTVYIQDYTLTFTADHPEYVLYIKDENDVVVYTTVVSSAQTQVTLPTTLSGEYKIELVMGNWLFTGWISLS